MGQGVERQGLIGRAAELGRLESALRSAAAGAGRTVLVAGEAGIGKTRLIAELAERARLSGALVLSGRCIDLVGTGVPYLAMAEPLRSLPGSPLPADLAPGPDGPHPRLHLFQQVRDALERQADEAPLVLIVEDVHWADASTLDLFSFLAHGIGQSRIMLVASYRSDEVGPDNGLARLVGWPAPGADGRRR